MSNFLPTLYQEFIYKSRYARWLDSEKRRENWSETVCRYFDYMEGHLKKNHDYVIPKSMREELEQAVLALEVMPSMRALMTAGPALDKDNTGAYNCSYVVVDDPKAFDESMVILMNGCFHPNTEIMTEHGKMKITDINPEISVLSYDIEQDLFEYIKPEWVVPTPHSAEKEKLELTFEDGTTIKCTEDHEFYTSNRGWVKAKDLTEDDDIRNYNE